MILHTLIESNNIAIVKRLIVVITLHHTLLQNEIEAQNQP